MNDTIKDIDNENARLRALILKQDRRLLRAIEALMKVRDCPEADLAKYCARVDAIVCEALTAIEIQE